MSRNKTKLTEFEMTGDRQPQLSLYEMVGLNVNPYKGKNLEEYKASIEHLTFADLQAHAVNVGVVPIDDKLKLLDRLSHQYVITVGQLQANAIQRDEAEAQIQASKKKSHLSKEQQKQVADMLSKGR